MWVCVFSRYAAENIFPFLFPMPSQSSPSLDPRPNPVWRCATFPARVLFTGLAELFPKQRDEELRAAIANGWKPDPPDAYCGRCGATCAPQAVTERGCPFCIGERPTWDRVVRLSAYVEPMDRWVRLMKFGREWTWADWAGGALAEVIGDAPRERVIVTHVPMHLYRRMHRGYDQAQLIAGELAKSRGWPAAALLRRVKHTTPQTRVAPSERAGNIRGSFAMRRIDLTGWSVWLVDDVKTSGATSRVCARLLKKAGAKSVSLAVMAVGDPKGADFTRK